MKIFLSFVIAIVLGILLVLPLQAQSKDTQALIIAADVSQVDGVYEFKFNEIIPANLVELKYLSHTIVLTSSDNLIDLSRANFTATELCFVYGSAQTMTVTEDGILIASFIDIIVRAIPRQLLYLSLIKY
jgi:putative cell wall-binding protein